MLPLSGSRWRGTGSACQRCLTCSTVLSCHCGKRCNLAGPPGQRAFSPATTARRRRWRSPWTAPGWPRSAGTGRRGSGPPTAPRGPPSPATRARSPGWRSPRTGRGWPPPAAIRRRGSGPSTAPQRQVTATVPAMRCSQWKRLPPRRPKRRLPERRSRRPRGREGGDPTGRGSEVPRRGESGIVRRGVAVAPAGRIGVHGFPASGLTAFLAAGPDHGPGPSREREHPPGRLRCGPGRPAPRRTRARCRSPAGGAPPPP